MGRGPITRAPLNVPDGENRMSDQLTRMLGERPWLLADGAMGTNLYNMGLAPGQAPDLWNDSQPDKVADLHRQMIAAGADLILTNSFGANATRLRVSGAAGRVAALNHAAAGLARDAAQDAKRPVTIAGSMGPTGEIMAPIGRLTEAEALTDCGVTHLRLMPQAVDMVAVAGLFRAGLDKTLSVAEAEARLSDLCGEVAFSNGFYYGTAGYRRMAANARNAEFEALRT
jgi:5-methyltetrahydrofolate--homocysteine methyltransferase